jgi:hypothetical protein
MDMMRNICRRIYMKLAEEKKERESKWCKCVETEMNRNGVT